MSRDLHQQRVPYPPPQPMRTGTNVYPIVSHGSPSRPRAGGETTSRLHHSGTILNDMLVAFPPVSRYPESATAPYACVPSHQPHRTHIMRNIDYPSSDAWVTQAHVHREVQLPLGFSVPNRYYRTVLGTHRDAQFEDVGFYDPSKDDPYTEPTSSLSSRGQSRRPAETNKPLYRAKMKYDGKGAGSSRGTAVNVSGCDLSAFTKMGLGVDEFLKLHEGLMRHNMVYGNQFEVTMDAEGEGYLYNVAGLGYNPYGP
ncbi:hypothetical protein BDQ17DRAFT_1422675 [Cyathus striatus]|nr:hypothetical protein BDQ17DRAFT_1422675 [Cyathus striatus]